eukprot:125771-Chlamydomonas_euryale.AAC.1
MSCVMGALQHTASNRLILTSWIWARGSRLVHLGRSDCRVGGQGGRVVGCLVLAGWEGKGGEGSGASCWQDGRARGGGKDASCWQRTARKPTAHAIGAQECGVYTWWVLAERG